MKWWFSLALMAVPYGIALANLSGGIQLFEAIPPTVAACGTMTMNFTVSCNVLIATMIP